MERRKGILLDVDGTMLDTRDFIYGAFEHAFTRLGHPVVSRRVMAQSMGKTLQECYEIFVPGGDLSALCQAHSEFQLANTHLTRRYPAILKTLQLLKQEGFALAAITSRYNTTHTTLEMTGVTPFLDLVVTGTDVTKLKPDPEGLFLAMEKLHLNPEETFMVGDTAADIRAGKAAGIKTVAALYGMAGRSVLQEEPDFVMRRFSELPGIVMPVRN